MSAAPISGSDRTYPELCGRRVMVTGAAAGIGRAIAEAFARAGCRTALLDHDAEGLKRALPGEPDVLRLEAAVDDEAAVDRAMGGIDILINNAGIAANKASLELTSAEWRRCMAINLDGVFFCSRAAGRRMAGQGSGVILNMASLYAVMGGAERLAYAASKSAVAMMTNVLAVEWAAAGVRVNALAPGYVATPFLERLIESGRLERAAIKARTPTRRLCRPTEVADLALFLAADRAAFVTGQILGIDGGWSANGFQRTSLDA